VYALIRVYEENEEYVRVYVENKKNCLKIKDAPNRKIIGYRIFGQNITSNIWYLIGYPRRQFFRVGYPTG